MFKFKKMLLMFILMLFVSISSTAFVVNAEDTYPITKEYLLNLEKAELLSVLKEEGLVLPEDYATHIYLAEDFVYKYTPMILDGEINPSIKRFSYEHSNEMMENLSALLSDLNIVTNSPISLRSTYSLQDSTTIGSWHYSYQNYNCYAYSIGRTGWLNPGDLSGDYFSMSMSISSMADVVLSDLESSGYWGYTTTTKPTSLPDEYFSVIAMRKDNSNEDYHFMRPYGSSLNSWSHKPSWTQPLKWNYASPSSKVWSNEAFADGYTYLPDITYESTVYYILYKSTSAPGIQPYSLFN